MSLIDRIRHLPEKVTARHIAAFALLFYGLTACSNLDSVSRANAYETVQQPPSIEQVEFPDGSTYRSNSYQVLDNMEQYAGEWNYFVSITEDEAFKTAIMNSVPGQEITIQVGNTQKEMIVKDIWLVDVSQSNSYGITKKSNPENITQWTINPQNIFSDIFTLDRPEGGMAVFQTINPYGVRVVVRTVEESIADSLTFPPEFYQDISLDGLPTGVKINTNIYTTEGQPDHDSLFVSRSSQSFTLFERVHTNNPNIVALIAHNDLNPGIDTNLLDVGDSVYTITNGLESEYVVTTIEKWRALSPSSPSSEFENMNNFLAAKKTSAEMYSYIYEADTTNRQLLVLQTCIEQDGEPTYGRKFVIAEKVK